MEGIREIARSYYERATEDEKKSIIEYFLKMDINGDGKVSHQEMKNSCGHPWLTTEDTFRKLDKDGDGALDIHDVICLYYMEKKNNMLRCNGCRVLLFGPHFSCMLCLGKPPNTSFDLCCSCYSGGGVSHEHSSDHMLDHHSIIMAFIRGSAEQAGTTSSNASISQAPASYSNANASISQAPASYSNAIVPANNANGPAKWMVALEALKFAAQIVDTANNIFEQKEL